MTLRMQTLNQIFPGEVGRLVQVRIMLRLGLPDLRTHPRDEPLDDAIATRLRVALASLRRSARR